MAHNLGSKKNEATLIQIKSPFAQVLQLPILQP